MSKIELPPPAAWICTRRLTGDKAVFDLPCTTANPAYVKAHPDHDWQPLYRDRQIVELCASVVESANNYDNPMTANDCADAIRSLLDPASPSSLPAEQQEK